MKRLRSVVLPALVALVALVAGACGQEGSSPVSPGASTGPLGPTAPAGAQTPAPTAGSTGSPTTSPGVTPSLNAPGRGSTAPTAPTGSTGVTNGALRTVKVGDVTMRALMGVGFPQFPAGDGIRKKAGLLVEYTIVNHGRQSVAVYDLVPTDLGSTALPEVNPEHAWVYMHDRSLRVSKQAFDTATGVDVAATPVTGIRPLAAGGTLTGRAWVPLPPKLDVPGKNFASPGGRGLDLDIFTWQFCAQVGDLAAQGGPVTDATPGPIVAPVSGPAQGELLCTAPGPLPSA